MSVQFNNKSSECRSVEPKLSDYIENALSAREVWEVEKHLAVCAECARSSQQMQATVQVLRGADRYDTADDFMARLHARLDEVAPEPARGRPLRDMAQNWRSSLQASMRVWHLPALTAGFAAVALVLMVHGNLSMDQAQPLSAPPVAAAAGEDLSRQVAFTASNPFDDPVAAKAEVDGAGANGVGSENRADSGGATANF